MEFGEFGNLRQEPNNSVYPASLIYPSTISLDKSFYCLSQCKSYLTSVAILTLPSFFICATATHVIIISSNVIHLNPFFLFLVDNFSSLNWEARALRDIRKIQGPRFARVWSSEFGVSERACSQYTLLTPVSGVI